MRLPYARTTPTPGRRQASLKSLNYQLVKRFPVAAFRHQIRPLNSLWNCSKSESGTCPFLTLSLQPSSSRTLVTESSAPSRYRFFHLFLPESSHGVTSSLSPNRARRQVSRGPSRVVSSWPIQLPFCEHDPAGAACEARYMLLPMRKLARPQRLHQNVRTAEVCFALVGENLRQASSQAARRQQRRRSSLALS